MAGWMGVASEATANFLHVEEDFRADLLTEVDASWARDDPQRKGRTQRPRTASDVMAVRFVVSGTAIAPRATRSVWMPA